MSNGRNVIALVTGSAEDDAVVSIACGLAGDGKGIVRLLYVIEVPRRLAVDAEVPAATARGELTLQRMEAVVRRSKRRVDGDLLQARDVGVAVLREAVDTEADAIVMGMPYTERYGSPTLGETAPDLVRKSPCAVIVYRGPQPPEAVR